MLVPKAEAWLKQFRETIATDAPQPICLATTHAIARVVIPTILSVESVELKLMRPDKAYEAVLIDNADIALVLDNAPWEEVTSIEVGAGFFQLYSAISEVPIMPVILPGFL